MTDTMGLTSVIISRLSRHVIIKMARMARMMMMVMSGRSLRDSCGFQKEMTGDIVPLGTSLSVDEAGQHFTVALEAGVSRGEDVEGSFAVVSAVGVATRSVGAEVNSSARR